MISCARLDMIKVHGEVWLIQELLYMDRDSGVYESRLE